MKVPGYVEAGGRRVSSPRARATSAKSAQAEAALESGTCDAQWSLAPRPGPRDLLFGPHPVYFRGVLGRVGVPVHRGRSLIPSGEVFPERALRAAEDSRHSACIGGPRQAKVMDGPDESG